MDVVGSQISVVQQRDIETQTSEDDTTKEYANFGEELIKMDDDTTMYYNFEMQEPDYLELCDEDSLQPSTVHGRLRLH